jgi:predicted peroxiredoxin
MNAEEKLFIMATSGPEDPERATLPFVMGCAALASDVGAVIGFQDEAVRLMQNGEAEKVQAPGFPPLADLLDAFRELDGTLLVCAPGIESREIPADDLLDGVEVVAAGRLVAEITSATATLTY